MRVDTTASLCVQHHCKPSRALARDPGQGEIEIEIDNRQGAEMGVYLSHGRAPFIFQTVIRLLQHRLQRGDQCEMSTESALALAGCCLLVLLSHSAAK